MKENVIVSKIIEYKISEDERQSVEVAGADFGRGRQVERRQNS